MDLNELFFRHQLAVMRADGSDDCQDRSRFHGLADGLATRIGSLQRALGAEATPLPLLAGSPCL